MKKIINGKKYDTETAQMVGVWDNNLMYNNFSYCAELLYRKHTGEFFLHGKGGAMSKYAVSCGDNSWRGGEKIIPLSEDEACKWAEEHLDWNEYEEIFGEVSE